MNIITTKYLSQLLPILKAFTTQAGQVSSETLIATLENIAKTEMEKLLKKHINK